MYPLVGSIPDLRLAGDSWLDHDEDLDQARFLLKYSESSSLERLVRAVYAARPGWDEDRIDMRTRQVLEAPEKRKVDVRGWLKEGLDGAQRFLDLGCGAGMLIAAAELDDGKAYGIDVSMVWLVVADRLVREYGGQPILAAAMAENMPLPNSSISFVVSLDVIEHVRDPGGYIKEINRILKPGGKIALTTPNRFSLTAEPHVFVWGVGWLPQRWQKAFVKMRSGKDYDDTCLLSYLRLKKLVRKNSQIIPVIAPGTVLESEIRKFPARRAALARGYNRVRNWPIVSSLLKLLAPFFEITGRKSD
jgi:SAM-dependent methyltransferase